MAKQQSKDELMVEFFCMLMADAQQAQKASAPHEEHMMDSFPRYREADHVLKYTLRVALRGCQASHLAQGDSSLEHQSKNVWGPHSRADGLDGRASEPVSERRRLFCSGLSAGRGVASAFRRCQEL